MWELSIDNCRDYLVQLGQLSAQESDQITWLSGGVSNIVLRVDRADGPSFVVKQSCAQLRTRIDWFSRIERIYREAEAQRALASLLPEGTAPKVLFEDRAHYCYGMQAIRADHVVWKRQLLAGDVVTNSFEQAGNMLADIHRQTAGRPELLQTDPGDTTVFHELRVDPFYLHCARVHPQIAPAVSDLCAEMTSHPLCLVHADFSPKNLLIHPDGISLVDFETVHYGDPAFDLGFFFSHLWLKATALRPVRDRLIAGINLAWSAYRRRLSASTIDFRGLSRRSVRHLAGCLLARIDGKSPVDYLTDPHHQSFLREMCLKWWRSPPADFDAAFLELEERVITLAPRDGGESGC